MHKLRIAGMKKLLAIRTIVAILLSFVVQARTTCYATTAEGNSELFKTKLSNYISSAKELSQKKMKEEEIEKLTDEAMSIIEDLKTHYMGEKLNVRDIKLKYLDGKDFPDPNEHKNNNATDQKIVQFTIASHTLFKIITKDIVSKIIEKSPLEMVAIIKELSVFMQFVSANPSDFGHGVFSEKQGDLLVVFATNDAITRIMKSIIYKNLLQNNKIYKMSRLGTYLGSNGLNNIGEEQLNGTITSLKRSTADDTRIAIDIPEAMLDLSASDATSEFQTTAKNYINEINLFKQSKDTADRQVHLNKALELAKSLLGVIPNTKINISKKVSEFCKVLEQERSKLNDTIESNDKKIALKAKRDMANYIHVENFLKCASSLVDTINNVPQILPLIVEKMPDFIPNIGQEITVFLRAFEMIIKQKTDAKAVISKFRKFAKSSEDGSYLMSPLLSVAMENVSSLDYKTILTSTDFSKSEVCKYLQIR